MWKKILIGLLILLLIGCLYYVIRGFLNLTWDRIVHTRYFRGVVVDMADYVYCSKLTNKNTQDMCYEMEPSVVGVPNSFGTVELVTADGMLSVEIELAVYEKKWLEEGRIFAGDGPILPCVGRRIGFADNTIRTGDKVEVLVDFSPREEADYPTGTKTYNRERSSMAGNTQPKHHIDLGYGSTCDSPLYYIRKIH